MEWYFDLHQRTQVWIGGVLDEAVPFMQWAQYRVAHAMLDFGEWCGDVWTWLFT